MDVLELQQLFLMMHYILASLGVSVRYRACHGIDCSDKVNYKPKVILYSVVIYFASLFSLFNEISNKKKKKKKKKKNYFLLRSMIQQDYYCVIYKGHEVVE